MIPDKGPGVLRKATRPEENNMSRQEQNPPTPHHHPAPERHRRSRPPSRPPHRELPVSRHSDPPLHPSVRSNPAQPIPPHPLTRVTLFRHPLGGAMDPHGVPEPSPATVTPPPWFSPPPPLGRHIPMPSRTAPGELLVPTHYQRC